MSQYRPIIQQLMEESVEDLAYYALGLELTIAHLTDKNFSLPLPKEVHDKINEVSDRIRVKAVKQYSEFLTRN